MQTTAYETIPGAAPPGARVRDHGDTVGAASPDQRYARLPRRAAAKLRRLAGEQSDLDSAIYSLSTRRQGFYEAKRTAEQNIRSYDEFRGVKIPLHTGEPRAGVHAARDRAIAAAEADLESASAELRDIDTRIARLSEKKSGLCAAVFTWLARLPGVDQFEEADPLAPLRLGKNDTWVSTLAGVRSKIAALRADAGEVASAPLPAALVKARARAQIEGLAAKPNVTAAIELGREVIFRQGSANVHVANGAGSALGAAQIPDAIGLVCWLFKDQLVAAIEREISAAADDAHALAPDARRQREVALASEILAAERLEEAAIEAAEVDGIELQRRVDLDPRALLGLSSSLAAPKASH